MSKTYSDEQAFLAEVIHSFSARMERPLVPSVRCIYAGGDMVIVFFDAAATAKAHRPYRNTYTWYLRMRVRQVISAFAFFDTRELDELWTQVTPS